MSTWEEVKMKARSFPIAEFLSAISIAESRVEEISRLQGENERLNDEIRQAGLATKFHIISAIKRADRCEDQLRTAEQEVVRWKDAYENMKDYAVKSGLDITCYGERP